MADSAITYQQWGADLDEQARRQMAIACRLPVSVAAALMPDAHVGYGLPIGGVLATEKAVMVYKNLDEVMAAQTDLVEPLAKFLTRVVKMAGAGYKAED